MYQNYIVTGPSVPSGSMSKGLQVKRSQVKWTTSQKVPKSEGLRNSNVRDKSKKETNTTTVVHTPCPRCFCGIKGTHTKKMR